MKEFSGSIWAHYMVPDHFICLTTNGTIKKDGHAVMGRGNAAQAKIMLPNVSWLLGTYLRKQGNRAGILQVDEFENCVVIFPVKHQWWMDADPVLIRSSAFWLKNEATIHKENTYHLPRPGCGNGHLAWEEVRPLVAELPDNVWVHHLDTLNL